MRLADLQHRFARALHYQASGETCDIVSDQFTADERIQIYRNNFVIGLSELLELSYPKTRLLLGEACFAQIARQHVLRVPLTQADVSSYGEGFETTLAQFPQVVEQVPCCREFARFEWTIELCQLQWQEAQKPSQAQPLDALAQIDPARHGEVRFHLAVGVACFAADYALFSLYQAIREQCFDDLHIEQPQAGVIQVFADRSYQCMPLTPAAFALLTQLEQQKALADIDAELLAELNALVELGVISHFSLP